MPSHLFYSTFKPLLGASPKPKPVPEPPMEVPTEPELPEGDSLKYKPLEGTHPETTPHDSINHEQGNPFFSPQRPAYPLLNPSREDAMQTLLLSWIYGMSMYSIQGRL